MQSHQVSVSGGKDGLDYYVSGSYLNQDGTVLGNNYDRYTFRSNINSQIKPWLKIGTSLTGSRSFQNTSLSNNTGIIYTALLSAPDQAVYNANGSFAGAQPGQIGAQINPVAQALSITNNLAQDNFNGSIYGDISFIKDLVLHSEFDANVGYSAAKYFQPTYNYDPLHFNPTATLSEYYGNSTYWSWKEYLTYTHTFAKKHALQLQAGHELINSVYHSNNAGISNFLSNTLQSLNLGTASTATVGEYIGNNDIIESEFGRAIYTFN
ncbi:MAG: SusC/RagA family protein, partial [Sphingobacteriaceae bacterium]